MASAMINPILPIFVVYYLHEGMDKLGIIVAVSTFFSYFLRVFSGYISDRFGHTKSLVVSGYALSAISKPLIGFTSSYIGVAFLKSLERVGKALRSAPKDAMLSYFGKKMGKTFGFHKTLDIAGELSGTIILFVFLLYLGKSESHIREIFFYSAIPGFIALFLVIFFVEDIKHKKRVSSYTISKKDKVVIKEIFNYFLFIFFFFNEAFFTMQAKKVGIDTALIPLLFMLSTFSQTITSYISGVFIDRFGARKILFLSYIFGTTAMILLYLKSYYLTWIAYVFLGLFTVFSLNANRAYIATFSQNRGTVYGIFYAGVAVFGALGALLIGYIWQKFGIDFSTIFSLTGTVSVTLYLFTRIIFASKSR